MIVQDDCGIPEPKSRFANITCDSCDSSSIVFTMTKSRINCKFCGNILAEPTGGKAQIFGRLGDIADDIFLTDVKIKTITKDSEKKLKRLLLDSMIIHKMINSPFGQIFANDVSNYSLCLVVLDRILIETINMEKEKYAVSLTKSDIIEKLEQIGSIEIVNVDHASKDMIAARDMCDSKKYVDSRGIGLSATDCMLLQIHLGGSADLVTCDKALIDAAGKEGRPLTYDCIVSPN